MRKSGLEIIGLGRILHYTDSARNDPRPRGGDAYKYRGTIFQHDNALCIDRYGRRLSRTNPNYRIREARPQPDADRLRPPRRARARAAPTRPVDSEHSRTRVIHPPAQRACALRPACTKRPARGPAPPCAPVCPLAVDKCYTAWYFGVQFVGLTLLLKQRCCLASVRNRAYLVAVGCRMGWFGCRQAGAAKRS